MLAEMKTVFMTRKVYESWGEMFNWKPLPKNVASVYRTADCGFGIVDKWKPVTWDEVFKERREKQKEHLESIRGRDIVTVKPCFVEVFYNNTNFFSGWWIYVITLDKYYAVGFRDQNKQLILPIMKLYPCGFLPLKENFAEWAAEFARIYHRPTRERKKNIGMVAAWAKIDRGYLVEIIKEREKI